MTLEQALEVVAFKDAQPFRQAVFDYLAGHQPAVRSARAVYRRLPGSRLPLAFVGLYGLHAFLAVELPDGGRLLAFGRYRNEARQFDHLARVLGEPIGRADLSARAALRPASLRALLRLARDPERLRSAAAQAARLDRVHRDFLVGARVAATAGTWLRLAQELPGHGAQAVLVSSDSNPYAMAALAIARERGLKTLYITHGHIPDGPPPLDVDLAIVDGPAVLRVYDDSLGRRGAVVFKGAEGQARPMATAGLRAGRPLVLGLFMSLIVDWDRFAPLLGALRQHLSPARIILRLHPNEVIRDPRAVQALASQAALGPGEVELSRGERILTEDAARCDLVIAGNSSAHLTLLRFGVPTLYLPGLDLVPHDFYRFLACRIVAQADSPDQIDLAAVAAFYEDPAWADRFRDFDAGYGVEGLDGQVRAAILDLLEPDAP